MIFYHRKTMTAALAGCLAAMVLASHAGAAIISNPWSGAAGDRASYSAFAFNATGGLYPNSADPVGALDSFLMFSLDSLTFTRPANDTAGNVPIIGTGNGQLSSVAASVFLDIYSSRDGSLSYSGYLGSSANSVIYDDGNDPIEPGESFTFEFEDLTLQKDVTYWLVFSEDAVEGEISSFRTRVNTSGDDATPGSGRGYLVGDTAQVEYPGALQDWAVEYVAQVTPIPEPASMAVIGLLLALGAAAIRNRRMN